MSEQQPLLAVIQNVQSSAVSIEDGMSWRAKTRNFLESRVLHLSVIALVRDDLLKAGFWASTFNTENILHRSR